MLDYKNFIQSRNITIYKKENDYYINFFNDSKNEFVEKKINLQNTNIKEQFSNQKYNERYKNCKRNEALENFMMVPFSFHYYETLAKNASSINGLIIPRVDLFTQTYIEKYCKKLPNGNYTFKEDFLFRPGNIEFTFQELQGRMLRGYNSYNREIEFCIKAMKKLKDCEISYDLSKDMLDGVDLFIKYKGKQFAIAEYVGTKRAMSFKNIKNTNRHDYSDYEMIDLIANFDGPEKNTTSCGDVLIYSDDCINDILTEMDDRISRSTSLEDIIDKHSKDYQKDIKSNKTRKKEEIIK